MHAYWVEFSQVAIAHLLAVASPGPDFAIVLRQSLAHGRTIAVATAIGVGAAVFVHVGYSLLGLGLLIRGSEGWFAAVKYAGAAYIAWLGVQSLRAKPRAVEAAKTEEDEIEEKQTEQGDEEKDAVGKPSVRSAFLAGFLTNALNPKATLFFLSLFALIVSPATPKGIQAAYGVWMALATMGWFALVAVLFTQAGVRGKFLRYGHWIDRVLGVVFLGFAVGLLFAKR